MAARFLANLRNCTGLFLLLYLYRTIRDWLQDLCVAFSSFPDEECVKQGVEFVPARLRQKTRPRDTDDGMESAKEGGSRSKHKQKEKKKQDSGIWAPSSSEGEGSDSEDSMSDLYPCKRAAFYNSSVIYCSTYCCTEFRLDLWVSSCNTLDMLLILSCVN